jgi:hypothetical protein
VLVAAACGHRLDAAATEFQTVLVVVIATICYHRLGVLARPPGFPASGPTL